MKFEEEAKLLTAESRAYKVDGNEGVSHRVRVLVGGEIFSCKSTEEQVLSLKEYEDKDGVAVMKLNSRKENLSLELVSFEPAE